MSMTKHQIVYTFYKDGNLEFDYDVQFDPETLCIEEKSVDNVPEWCRLEFQQCEHCPYTKEEKPVCPVAANIHVLIERFMQSKSTETYHTKVATKERVYSQECDLQTALRSVLGLEMALSSCQYMDFLKPMARFHLPFASIDETIFRSISSFLITEYLNGDLQQETAKDRLLEHYAELKTLNQRMIQRIDAIEGQRMDADLNAMVILDSLAKILEFELDSEIASLEPLMRKKEKR
jgi:hypothetical protein